MKRRLYRSVLIGIPTILIVLFMTVTYATASEGLDSSSDPAETKIVAKHDGTGNWQTILLEDGTECEGPVFESSEDAEAAAAEIGCSGYHEHQQEDGTFVYMPCTEKDIA